MPDREVSGAVALAGGNATVHTASTAGASQSSSVTALLSPQVPAEGLSLASEDPAPLPDSDMAGLAGMLFLMVLVIGAAAALLRLNPDESAPVTASHQNLRAAAAAAALSPFIPSDSGLLGVISAVKNAQKILDHLNVSVHNCKQGRKPTQR